MLSLSFNRCWYHLRLMYHAVRLILLKFFSLPHDRPQVYNVFLLAEDDIHDVTMLWEARCPAPPSILFDRVEIRYRMGGQKYRLLSHEWQPDITALACAPRDVKLPLPIVGLFDPPIVGLDNQVIMRRLHQYAGPRWNFHDFPVTPHMIFGVTDANLQLQSWLGAWHTIRPHSPIWHPTKGLL